MPRQPYLVSPLGIANGLGLSRRYGVSKAAVANWRERFDDFPEPLHTPYVEGIPLWQVSTVDAWFRQQFPGRKLN